MEGEFPLLPKYTGGQLLCVKCAMTRRSRVSSSRRVKKQKRSRHLLRNGDKFLIRKVGHSSLSSSCPPQLRSREGDEEKTCPPKLSERGNNYWHTFPVSTQVQRRVREVEEEETDSEGKVIGHRGRSRTRMLVERRATSLSILWWSSLITLYHPTCLGTSRLLCIFISAPVGVRDLVNVARNRCISTLMLVLPPPPLLIYPSPRRCPCRCTLCSSRSRRMPVVVKTICLQAARAQQTIYNMDTLIQRGI